MYLDTFLLIFRSLYASISRRAIHFSLIMCGGAFVAKCIFRRLKDFVMLFRLISVDMFCILKQSVKFAGNVPSFYISENALEGMRQHMYIPYKHMSKKDLVSRLRIRIYNVMGFSLILNFIFLCISKSTCFPAISKNNQIYTKRLQILHIIMTLNIQFYH